MTHDVNGALESPLQTARASLTRSRANTLETLLRDVRARLKALASPTCPEHPGAGSEPDGDAAVETMCQVEVATERERLILEARALVAALDRVRAGTYGTCAECSEPIPEKRLLAQPTAELCVRCRAEEERRATRVRRAHGWIPEPDDAPIEEPADELSGFPERHDKGEAW